MQPTTIFFVRHGEVYNQKDILYARLPRYKLSEKGRQEVQLTAKFLRRESIDVIYSSPMLRARQTAQIIREFHPDAPLHLSKYLNEIRTSYQGATREVLNSIDWDFYDHRLSDDDETREQILERLQQQLRLTLRRHAGGKVVWVAHGDLVIVFTLWGKGMPLGALRDFKGSNYIGHGSVTRFVFDAAHELPLSVAYFDPAKRVSGDP
jgi:broad specificity phosphatase PhoE